MRSCCRACAAAVVAAVLTPRDGHAQATTFQTEASVAVGASDNILAAPPDAPNAQADAFVSTHAGLNVHRAASRSTNRLAYSFAARLYARDSTASALSHQLTLGAGFAVGQSTQLTLDASLSHGRMSGPRPPGQMPDPSSSERPAGPLYVLGTSVREALVGRLGPAWGWSQALAMSHFQPLDADGLRPTSVAVQHQVGAERLWARDALTGSLRLGHTVSSEVRRGADLVAPERRLTLGEILFGWRHEVDAFLSFQVEAGVLGVGSIEHERAVGGPAARGTGTYQRPAGRLVLEAAHTVQPSILLGQTMLVDRAMLRGATWFGQWDRVQLVGSVGYQRGRAVSPGGTLAGTLDVRIAEASAAYRTDGPLRFSLAYTFMDQSGSGSEGFEIESFRQNLVMVTVTAVYPHEIPGGAGQ